MSSPDAFSAGATLAASLVCLGALGFIGLLPRIFFRPGRLNPRWWLTAAPFGLAGATLVGGMAGLIDPLTAELAPALTGLTALAATTLGCASIALIGYTLGSHTRPVSLWHQDDDRPDELVTSGAYARVRHPFYASFLLVLTGCALALPHALTLLALGAAVLQLNRTAAREERRLRAAFGRRYTAYMRVSGRFLPRLVD